MAPEGLPPRITAEEFRNKGRKAVLDSNGGSKPSGGRLNPRWVEWLMQWPIGWTSLEPLAMDGYLSVQWLHGISSLPE
jgi:hypothetical protein